MILGICDSGLGGLTVLKEILKNNTFEKIVYFGDTARIPYGDKDKATLVNYGKEDIEFLRSKGAEEIIVACGTLSTNVIDDIKDNYDFKIVGIVEAACKQAIETTKNNRIGVIATPATINTHIFKEKLSGKEVFEVACEKFTPLIEARKKDSKEMEEAIKEYIEPLKEKGIDTLILGCTHYPILSEKISKVLDDKVHLINSAEELNKQFNVGKKTTPEIEIYVSGDIDDFVLKAKELIGEEELKNVKNK